MGWSSAKALTGDRAIYIPYISNPYLTRRHQPTSRPCTATVESPLVFRDSSVFAMPLQTATVPEQSASARQQVTAQ